MLLLNAGLGYLAAIVSIMVWDVSWRLLWAIIAAVAIGDGLVVVLERMALANERKDRS